MSEIYGPAKFDLAALGCRIAMERRVPVRVSGRILAVEGKDFLTHEAAHFPLSAKRKPDTVAHVLTVYTFDGEDRD